MTQKWRCLLEIVVNRYISLLKYRANGDAILGYRDIVSGFCKELLSGSVKGVFTSTIIGSSLYY